MTQYAPRGSTIQERLDFYTIPEALTGCWIFWGSVNGGPAYLYKKSGNVLAHQLAYERHYGPIPRWDVVDFTPSVRSSSVQLNPIHLFLGTLADNNHDRNRKGRQATGKKPNVIKLTEQQAREIFGSSEPTRILAERFGISVVMVNSIRTKKSWHWLHGTFNSKRRVPVS